MSAITVHIQVLEKRADYLAHRVAEARAKGRDLSFDASELRALNWAIHQLRPLVDQPSPYADRPGVFRP